jgi:hypothetical protein
MTPEKQRTAIAKICGWEDTGKGLAWNKKTMCAKIVPGTKVYEARVRMGLSMENVLIPDYLNDLNLMADAEKTLTDEQYLGGGWTSHDDDFSYNGWLNRIVGNATPVDRPVRYASATAAQRAEAFLKTIGKWEE